MRRFAWYTRRVSQSRRSVRLGCWTDAFFDERGFSTAGTAVAILLSCSLVCFSAWAVQSQSRATKVQSVADAAALAAEAEVAEFMISVKVADATLLTISLTGLTLLGVGIVCCCVPPIAGVGDSLIEAGEKVLEKRKVFAEKSAQVLNLEQAALPVVALTQAESVMFANAEDGTTYIGYMELVPREGEEIEIPGFESVDDALDTATDASDTVAELADTAEEASEEADDAWIDAYLEDCGYAPNYCMQQRAETLSSISPSENPLYHSSTTWSFDVPLKRAQAYYRARLRDEAPMDATDEEGARSALRKNVFAYAVDVMDEGYVIDDGVSAPELHFPLLPKNTSEMKETPLYTNPDYPVSAGEHAYIHAWAGCPQYQQDGSGGYGSLSGLDAGSYEVCPACGLDSVALGQVLSASTNIENGFEYHYRKVAEAAEEYERARSEALPAIEGAKSEVDDAFGELTEAFKDVLGYRIEAYPPGRFGAVVELSAREDGGRPVGFVSTPEELGSFTAFSAAVLVEDESEDVISSLLEGASADADSVLLDCGTMALSLWASLLGVYKGGVDGLTDGVEKALDGLPLIGASGLGTWAADEMRSFIGELGMEPANTSAAKPTLVNTAYVVAHEDGPLSQTIRALKGVP
ncbi:Uncharacterised protein [Slackia heliotrinireducens]|uniref:hypothetical protein n=1 Tax=Slackia heliotrinireducens TaxID=84110 RepID=UPI000F6D7789|nr:hypothetical protein [Slackia heliotrinireducens]VEH01943.1 Uncharacterised protein [Slackia heliotrinireducens]